jgi:hypothetical protein
MGRVTYKTKAASELSMPLGLIRLEPVFASCVREGCYSFSICLLK